MNEPMYADKEKGVTQHFEDASQREFEDPQTFAYDEEQEKILTKRVLRKLDVRALPMLAILFLFSFLDRTNIGNAKVLGLQKDLHLTDSKYSNCLAIFFAFYIASEIPSNLIIKKVSPRLWLSILTFAWGVIGMCMGFVQNYTGLMVVRAFLGVAEGGLLPGIVFYLSVLYKRSEVGFRLGLIYSSASLSGAFGGLLARGLNEMGGRGGLEGWRWIIIIEGILTALVGVMAYFVLPDTVDKAKFLDPEEKHLATQRLLRDRPVEIDESGRVVVIVEQFKWKDILAPVLSPMTWLSAGAYFAILTALYSFSLFVPTIITGLGYTAVRSQLFSVPPYAVAAVLTVIAAYVSDRRKIRGPIMLCFLPLSIAGYAIIRSVSSNSVRYGALFLMAAGLYPSVPPVLVWLSGNNPHHWRRATAIGLQLAIANCGGFPATFIYHNGAPDFRRGHTICMGLLAGAWVAVAIKCAYLTWRNKQKASSAMARYKGCGDERDPDFKFII